MQGKSPSNSLAILPSVPNRYMARVAAAGVNRHTKAMNVVGHQIEEILSLLSLARL